MSESALHEGGCDCRAVRYEVRGPMRDVVNCHCGQCRRTHGHFGAYTSVARDRLRFTEDAGLCWYQSSPTTRRGFCGRCGSSIFWDRAGLPTISIAAGTLDPPTGLRTVAHIFTRDAGDYYRIEDDLKQFPGSMLNG
jgi:hypothetical protein